MGGNHKRAEWKENIQRAKSPWVCVGIIINIIVIEKVNTS